MSLVRFKAKNHPQQTTRDDVDDRRTPRDFFDPLHDVERFTLDAAASRANPLLSRYFVRDEPQRAQNALVRSSARQSRDSTARSRTAPKCLRTPFAVTMT